MESHDFVGCIMEFAVNGRPLEPSQALAAQGILDQYVCYIWYQIDSIYDIGSQHETQAPILTLLDISCKKMTVEFISV